MKNIFRDFFTFNKRERNGVFILLSIICVLILYLNISSHFVNQDSVDFTKFDKEVDEFQASIKESDVSSDFSENENAIDRNVSEPTTKIEYFNFDPNGLSEANWKRLGLTDKQIKSIKKYESKGGRFRKKDDVKKMYCIKSELYLILEPYIQISSSEINKNEEKTKAVFQDGKVENPANKNALKTASLIKIELNSADSAMLTTIKGVGAFYAKNIIKYRNSIGGFVSKEQLLEIWKFDQEKLNSIEKFIDIDISKIKKVNINTCEAAELKSAYINWNIANAIVNYRKSHGKYKSVEEIKKTDLVNEETYRKIVPYLVIE